MGKVGFKIEAAKGPQKSIPAKSMRIEHYKESTSYFKDIRVYFVCCLYCFWCLRARFSKWLPRFLRPLRSGCPLPYVLRTGAILRDPRLLGEASPGLPECRCQRLEGCCYSRYATERSGTYNGVGASRLQCEDRIVHCRCKGTLRQGVLEIRHPGCHQWNPQGLLHLHRMCKRSRDAYHRPAEGRECFGAPRHFVGCFDGYAHPRLGTTPTVSCEPGG